MRSARQESLVVGATGVLARQQEELKPAHLLRRTLSSCGFLVSPPSTLVISSGVRPQPNAVERPCVPLVKNLLSLERRASSPVSRRNSNQPTSSVELSLLAVLLFRLPQHLSSRAE